MSHSTNPSPIPSSHPTCLFPQSDTSTNSEPSASIPAAISPLASISHPTPPLLSISTTSTSLQSIPNIYVPNESLAPAATASPIAPVNVHPMTTRSKNGISKQNCVIRLCLTILTLSPLPIELLVSFLNGLRP